MDLYPRLPAAIVPAAADRSVSVNQDAVPVRSHESEVDNDFNIRVSVNEVIDHFQGHLAGEMVPGLSTGFEELDGLTTGLKAGEVFVIASQPGMGKTSLMLRIVEYICIDQKVPTLIFSGQATAFETTQRLMFSRAKFALHEFYRGRCPMRDDLVRIQQAAEEIAQAGLFVDDRAGLEIDVLRERARRYRGEKEIGFIAIDDLRLLKSNSARAERCCEQERVEVSAGIKGLARELGIPILVLADLHRRPDAGMEGGDRRISDISDFRDSGAVGQNADLVGWLNRTNYDAENAEEKEADAGRAELILAKNRNGKTGWVPLLFIEDIMRFETCPAEPMRSNSCEADEIREAWDSHRGEEVDEREDSISAEAGFDKEE